MNDNDFTFQSYLIRFVFALILIFTTYNPSGYSLYHWAMTSLFAEVLNLRPVFVLSMVVLLIGWTIYLRATFRSLGPFGLTLAFAFFGVLIWVLIDLGWVGLDSVSALAYITETLLAAVLAIGMSWSHIRRRMSGQLDTDEADE